VVTLGWSALAQYGDLPLHDAATYNAKVQVVCALLEAHLDGASTANKV